MKSGCYISASEAEFGTSYCVKNTCVHVAPASSQCQVWHCVCYFYKKRRTNENLEDFKVRSLLETCETSARSQHFEELCGVFRNTLMYRLRGTQWRKYALPGGGNTPISLLGVTSCSNSQGHILLFKPEGLNLEVPNPGSAMSHYKSEGSQDDFTKIFLFLFHFTETGRIGERRKKESMSFPGFKPSTAARTVTFSAQTSYYWAATRDYFLCCQLIKSYNHNKRLHSD